MKNKIINKMILLIKKNTNYTSTDLKKIRYGLEGLYLMITKFIIIFGMAFILGILKETFILFVVFGGLRFFGFGVHAKTSTQCLIYSLLLFIVLPMLFYNMKLNLFSELLIFIICFINLLFFAPGESESRRFKKKKKYLIRKICTLIVATIYSTLYFILNDYNEVFMISIIIQSIVVNPLTYKLMGIKYNYNFLGLNSNI